MGRGNVKMRQNCKRCGIEYNSEGHKLNDWLTLCLECNEKQRLEWINI